MNSPSSPPFSKGDMPLTPSALRALHQEGLISHGEFQEAMTTLTGPLQWGLWVSRGLLAVGVTFFLTGVICLFAFNWEEMPSMAKFAVLQGAVAGCLMAAFFVRHRPLPLGALLVCASVLVGVFWAVFGQIYQTGADEYTLFVAWAILIFPWVLGGAFAPLWALWAGIAHVGGALYATSHGMDYTPFFMVGQGILLILREYFLLKGHQWLSSAWIRGLCVVPLLMAAGGTVGEWIMDSFAPLSPRVLMALFVHVALYGVYRSKIPHKGVVMATGFSVCCLGETLLLWGLGKIDAFDNPLTIMLGGLLTLGLFTGGAFALRNLAQQMEAEHGHGK